MRRKRKRKARPSERAVGYVRASTSKQALTAGAQTRQLEAWAKAENFELLGVYVDQAKSGTLELEKRPGWCEMMEAIADLDAGTVLVVDLSRVARTLLISQLAKRELEIAGARLVDVATAHLGDGSEAETMRDVSEVFNARERRAVSIRTKRLIADLKAQGKAWNKTPPYGYQWIKGKVALVAAEQRALRAIKRWRSKGHSITACRDQLEKKGYPPRGKAWHRTTVARIIRRLEAEAAA